MTRFGLVCLAVVAVVLPGAAPDATVEDLLRRGNTAFTSGDYAAALAFYDRAEERTTDPGLVAYNKATALYRLAASDTKDSNKLFHDAGTYYRAAASTSPEPRRSRALFGLGNSLLQAHGEEVAALRQAIRCYRQCLANPLADPALAENTRHNLELAKLLWVKAVAKDPQADPQKKDDSDGGNSSQSPMGPDEKPMQGGSDPSTDPNRKGAGQQTADPKSGQQPIPTQDRVAGAGSVPPGDDADKPPLTPEEADLNKKIKDIEADRDRQRIRSTRTPAGPVKDW